MKTGFSMYVYAPTVYMYCMSIFCAVFFVWFSVCIIPQAAFLSAVFSIIAAIQALSIYRAELKYNREF